MTINRMREEDLSQVAVLEQQLFSEPWSEQGFRDTLDMDGVIFLVARDGENCMGYCGIYLAADEGEITNVAVHPHYRRKGVARCLLQQLLQQMCRYHRRKQIQLLRRSFGTKYPCKL